MSVFAVVVIWLSVVVVLVRCICISATLSRMRWEGHQARFAGVAAAHALLAGGAVGMLYGLPHAPVMLLAGVAGWIVFERRRSC